ncbi:hypothetical protein [Sphingomonas lycopersici]|uniref:Uncharacterized protein n=1 Tax=Sphingomonas lycopersici TaxID=2951807 RepID=A0AA41Z8I0_9SPHN|nr:hypothetical protein [Sphingomonas lycopersici]MCW6535950.1 hypothetical protein [Sphingomonas lycopersici]
MRAVNAMAGGGTLAMVERSGPTTQAGIPCQNSVAAPFLGYLLRWDVLNPAERVIETRLEVPADVDDIVVRHADGHRDWIQVKLDLEPRGNAREELGAGAYIPAVCAPLLC